MKLADLISLYDPTDKTIGRPYIIAEAGVNHEGSMDTAKRLIEEAKEGGANAIKFQTYKAHTLASKYSPAYWDTSKEPTTSQYELFKKHDTFWKAEFEALKIHCDKVEIEFLSTPFDVTSAHFLNDLMEVYKISSSDITNLPFIELMCGFGKPILLSTGASYLWEIQQAVEWIEEKGNPLCLMHCILNYPTMDEHANLGMIIDLARKFPEAVPGYSDHTLPKGMEVLKIATLLGCRIIEKHFTHDKTLSGNDHYHAMDKADLKHFHRMIDQLLVIMGSPKKRPLASEEIARQNARRSLVATVDIAKGSVIESRHLTWKRPAYGVSPAHIEQIIGKTALRNIVEDEVFYF